MSDGGGDDPDFATPPVVVWFKVYAGLMAGLYRMVAVGGVALLRYDPARHDPAMPAEDALVTGAMGYAYAGLGLVFFGVFLMAVFHSRAPWAWIFAVVLICLSFTNPCCLPAGIPLLIYWHKPETKRHFGRRD